MKKLVAAFIHTLSFCLVLGATSAYFKNTEAFLNGVHHFDKSRHHDYDQNGKKDSTHHKHGSPMAMLKLSFVSQQSRLVIVRSPVAFESSAFVNEGPLKTEEYKTVIFRPPIHS
ncbi:MAG: hypothetical protein ACJ76H_11105 [Bacteriovoracaceae bacterium]